MAAAAAAELGVLHDRDGLVIACTPVGTDQFVRAFLFRKRQEVRDKVQRLVDLPHPLSVVPDLSLSLSPSRTNW
jgi:hypothetical protein